MGDERDMIVSGNWKMHEDHVEALKLVQALGSLLRASGLPKGREVSIHPPFTSLRTVQTAVETDHVPVALGAQTCHVADSKPCTGEVSAEMLAKLHVSYVIAGHSERRAQCGETDEIVRSKLDAIYRHGMRPILCVGETMTERQDGAARAKVRRQLVAALDGRRAQAVAAAVIACEPIWAIGTGQKATPEDVEGMADNEALGASCRRATDSSPELGL